MVWCVIPFVLYIYVMISYLEISAVFYMNFRRIVPLHKKPLFGIQVSYNLIQIKLNEINPYGAEQTGCMGLTLTL